jgi:hypothetical protein
VSNFLNPIMIPRRCTPMSPFALKCALRTYSSTQRPDVMSDATAVARAMERMETVDA